MTRFVRRLAGAATASAAFAAFLVATPETVATDVETDCLAVDTSQVNYDTQNSPESAKLDRLAGALTTFIMDRCMAGYPGERITIHKAASGAVDLVLRRHMAGDGTEANQGGSYQMSVATVLTPEGKLSPVGATHMSVGLTANQLRAGVVMPTPLYEMEANFDLGGWQAAVVTTGDGVLFNDPEASSTAADHIVPITQAIMADAQQGAAILPPRS